MTRSAGQRAALLAVARAAAPRPGRCYDALIDAIRAAGGYGDLLDLRADPRFQDAAGRPAFDRLGAALGLVRAVEAAGGPARLGLERLEVSPVEAPPGALLVTRHNGHPRCPIDPRTGDVAVVDGLQGGTLDAPVCRLVRDAPRLDDDLRPLPGPQAEAGAWVRVVETLARAGRPVACRVEVVQGPLDGGPGAPAGLVPRDALAEVPRGLLVHGGAPRLFPGTAGAWSAPAWAGTVAALYVPARPRGA